MYFYSLLCNKKDREAMTLSELHDEVDYKNTLQQSVQVALKEVFPC